MSLSTKSWEEAGGGRREIPFLWEGIRCERWPFTRNPRLPFRNGKLDVSPLPEIARTVREVGAMDPRENWTREG